MGPSADLSGTVLRGYEVQDQIATGGFGAIYRAVQTSVGREVAIKVILPQFASQPDFIRRFETEARLIARLEHPHIVPLYDFWREPEGAYLVMRWFPSGSLRSEIDRGPASLDDVLTWMGQITAALSTAHQQGVIHRDIKPDNVLVDAERNAYLTDFGIAKVLESTTNLTKEGKAPGSPAYSAPEQALAEPLSSQTDIYCLGVVLYELLTGEHPFPDLTPAQQLLKHIQEPLPPLKDKRSGLPVGLEAVIQQATAKAPGERYETVMKMFTALQEAALEAGSQADLVTGTLVNPYKGLRAFQEADAADFYGREALVEQLLAELDDSRELHRFLAIVGPSGSGKSSLVKAGLIPAVKRGALPDSAQWFVLEMQPGPRPLEELEIGLIGLATEPVGGLREQLERDEHGLFRAARIVLPKDDSQLLLVIDQFEEIFTLGEDNVRAKHFMSLLHAVATDPRSRVRVVVTIRADFYDRPLLFPGFSELVRDRTFAIVPLSSEELTSAIVSPARATGVSVTSGLIAKIVADVLEQPGALPLLQYAMTELFDRREDGSIKRDGYDAIGGVFGALGKRSEEVYDALELEGQEIARQLFLRLVTLGEGTEDTRRRVLRSEITSLWEDPATADAVIEAFGASRLLSFDHDLVSRDPTIEVAHEALIGEWDRFGRWLDRSRADVRLQRLLAGGAAEWLDADRDPGFLLRGSRLDQFEAWSARTELALSQDERTYLDASLAERREREAEEAERQAHEAKLERRSRIVLRALVGVMAIATLVGIGLAGVAQSAQQEAEVAQEDAEAQAFSRATQQAVAEAEAVARATQQQLAETASIRAEDEARDAFSRELAAASIAALGSDPQLALLLALQSVEQTYASEGNVLTEAEDALHRAVQATADRMIQSISGREARLWSIAFNPDGTRMVTYGTLSKSPIWQTTGLSRVWDVATGELQLTVPGFLISEHWPLDERLATITNLDGTSLSLVFWDSSTGEAVSTFELETRMGNASGAEIPGLRVDDIDSAILSPDWRRFSLTLSPGDSVQHIMWDLSSLEVVYSTQEQGGTTITNDITSVAFSPREGYLLAGAPGGRLSFLDFLSEDTLETVLIGGEAFRDIDYSPDGSRIATASTCEDFEFEGGEGSCPYSLLKYKVHVLDAESLREPVILSGGAGETWSVAFSPDGKLLAAAGRDGRAKVWELETGQKRFTFSGHRNEVTDVAFSPDGSRLATTSMDGTLKLWNLRGDFGYELFRVPAIPDQLTSQGSMAVSPDGSRLLSATSEQAVELLDTISGQSVFGIDGMSSPIAQLAFSPDGDQIIILDEDGDFTFWDVSNGDLKLRLPGFHACCFNFSPDGSSLAITTGLSSLMILDFSSVLAGGAVVQGGQVVRPFGQAIAAIGFSADGMLLAVSGDSGALRVFETTTGERLRTLDVLAYLALAIDFSPVGNRMATANSDGVIRIRDVESRETPLELSGHLGPVVGVAFSPDGTRLATASQDGTVKLWNSETGDAQLTLFVSNSGVTDVAFSPDGTRLYAHGADGVTKGYLLDIDELLDLAKFRLDRGFADAECVKYLHVPQCPPSD